MIKSISYWAFPGGLAGQKDIEQAIAEAAEAGFDALELAIGSSGQITPSTTEARCREIVEAAKKNQIRIASVCTGEFWGTSLTDPKPAVRKKALAFLKDALKVTAHLQAGALLVVPGCVHADFIPNCVEVPYDECYKTALAQIRQAAKVAEKYKTFICVENVWNKFLLSPLEFRQFIKECRSRWVGAYFDVANNVPYGVPSHWIAILGKAIKRVHFKEYAKRRNPDGSVTWTGFPEGFEVPLGKGDVDYPAVIKALKKIGYKGPVTYELLNFSGDAGAIKRCSREMDEVLGRKRKPGSRKGGPDAGTVVVTEASAKDSAKKTDMQISLAGWSIHRRFFDKTVTLVDFPKIAAQEFGISMIELNSPFFQYVDQDKQATSAVRTQNVKDIKKSALDSGVTCLSIAVDGHGNLAALDEAERKAAVEGHRKWFDICNELGCTSFRANSGGHGPEGTEEQQIQQCIKSFTELAEIGRANRIVVTMENHGGISYNADVIVRIMTQINSPYCRVLADFLNWPKEDDKLANLRKVAPFAFATHAKFLTFDAHGESPEIDAGQAVKILREAGYRNPYGIEYEGKTDDHEGVLKSKALLLKYA